jgi:YidC/Oxa1 family membrane protein insertase
MNPLDLLEAPMRAILEFFHALGFTWGWAIVMLTLLVRLILLPLFVKQYKSARRMQEVAPQMKELQRKYKGNKPKLQEEMMKFYKENDVNPFGSCLPLVAQAPVFIALYYTLRNSATTFQDGTDLGFLHAIPNISVPLDQVGWGVIPLVAIYALSQLISSELSATAAMSKNQRWLMRLLPIGIVFFVFQFPVPAGVVIYWATTNLWTAGQQLVLKRRIEAEIEATEAKAKESGTKSSDDADVVVDEAPDDAVVENTDAVATAAIVATEPARGTPRRRSKKSDAAPPPPAAPEPTEAPAAPEEEAPADSPAENGSAKRQPPSRKKNVSGGPTRPAGKKKPPKRRK